MPKELISDVAYKFQYAHCYETYHGETVTHFDVKFGEHRCVSSILYESKIKGECN